jgi:hypothetical protein
MQPCFVSRQGVVVIGLQQLLSSFIQLPKRVFGLHNAGLSGPMAFFNQALIIERAVASASSRGPITVLSFGN